MRTTLHNSEVNEVVIEHVGKCRRRTVRHVSRTRCVDLDRLYDRINSDPMIQIKYVNTPQQLADVITKGSFTGDRWTQLTLIVNIKTAHHIYSNQCVSFFCDCESFIIRHGQTCRRIFHCIGKREREASSLRSNDCEENDTNAGMDFHAVPPPDYRAGGDSKR